MRLSNHEIQAIRSIVTKRDIDARIFAFGSRANDALLGGDIDLLILSKKLAFSDKIAILVDLKVKLGDQKIDLLISSPEPTDPFVISVLGNAIEL